MGDYVPRLSGWYESTRIPATTTTTTSKGGPTYASNIVFFVETFLMKLLFEKNPFNYFKTLFGCSSNSKLHHM
jgi:hypothetical protein